MVSIPGGSFDPMGHLYKDGRGKRVLSVTQVFTALGLVNYDRVNAEVLERKSQLGVAVHKAVEYLADKTLDWDTVAEPAMPYVIGADGWMRATGYQAIDSEQQGIHSINGMTYGYQYDHRGVIEHLGRQRTIILDIKTCDKESPTWALQTAAYAIAAPALLAGQRYLRAVLQLKPDGTARAFYYEDSQDLNAFQYMLYSAIWKQNHGLLEAA